MIKAVLLITLLGSPNYRVRERASRELARDYDSGIMTRLVCHASERWTCDPEIQVRLSRIHGRVPGVVCPYGYWFGLCKVEGEYDEGGFRPKFVYSPNFFSGLNGTEEDQWPFQETRRLYQQAIWLGVHPRFIQWFNDEMLRKLDSEISIVAQEFP